MELANSLVSLEVDTRQGAVSSLHNRKLGVCYTVNDRPERLFRLRTRDPKTGAIVALPLPADIPIHTECRKQDGRQEAILRFTLPAAEEEQLQVIATISLANDSPTFEWTVRVHNEMKQVEIVEVVCPILGGLRIGQHAADNCLPWPRWAGYLYTDVCKGLHLSGVYSSGSANMPWLDLFRGHGLKGRPGEDVPCGLFFASHDQSLTSTGLSCDSASDGQSVTLAMSKHVRIPPHRQWSSAPFVTTLHAGDWHVGADLYREWFSRWHPRPQPPRWLRECDGWLGSSFPKKESTSFQKHIMQRFAMAQELGLNYVQFWGQMIASLSKESGNCCRFAFPNPNYGTEKDLAEAVAAVRSAGGHIGFYINGMTWDPRWPRTRPEFAGKLPADLRIPDWEKGFKDHALMQANGRLLKQFDKPQGDDSPYPCLDYYMCPSAAGWQEHLHYWVAEKYARQYRVDAHYVDQGAAVAAHLCYNPKHEHVHSGEWGQGVLATFRRIKEDARRECPEFALATEGFGDAYSPFVDLFLVSIPPPPAGRYTQFPELVRYTFPDLILFDGSANGIRHATWTEMLHRAFLLGSRSDLFIGSTKERQEAVQVLKLRRQVKHILYPGRFMDDLGVDVADRRIRVKRTVLIEPSRRATALTIYNPDGLKAIDVKVDVSGLGPVREAASIALGADPTILHPTVEANLVTFQAPSEVLSAVLLVGAGDDIIPTARSAK